MTKINRNFQALQYKMIYYLNKEKVSYQEWSSYRDFLLSCLDGRIINKDTMYYFLKALFKARIVFENDLEKEEWAKEKDKILEILTKIDANHNLNNNSDIKTQRR